MLSKQQQEILHYRMFEVEHHLAHMVPVLAGAIELNGDLPAEDKARIMENCRLSLLIVTGAAHQALRMFEEQKAIQDVHDLNRA